MSSSSFFFFTSCSVPKLISQIDDALRDLDRFALRIDRAPERWLVHQRRGPIMIHQEIVIGISNKCIYSAAHVIGIRNGSRVFVLQDITDTLIHIILPERIADRTIADIGSSVVFQRTEQRGIMFCIFKTPHFKCDRVIGQSRVRVSSAAAQQKDEEQ